MSGRPTQRIVIQWTRFLPYHFSRVNAARNMLADDGVDVVGMETAFNDTVYTSFPSAQLTQDNFRSVFRANSNPISDAQMTKSIHNALDELSPTAVAINGYGFRDSLACLLWCLQTSTPAIVMSDSWERDFRRHWWREWLKSLVVRQFDSAFVAGQRHAEYMEAFGLPKDRIFIGYDVVDNAFFTEGAEVARTNRESFTQQLNLPHSYFFASGRFVERKNFDRLLCAFELYRKSVGVNAWDLVIAGDGPLMNQLQSIAKRPSIAGHVFLPGFFDYETLPAIYGLAKAFICPSLSDQWALVVNEAMAAGLPVLVSDRCGCAADLVREGRNGQIFDPTDVETLSHLMAELSASSVASKGIESKQIIERWSLRTFAEGLRSAYFVATRTKKSAHWAAIGKLLVRFCMSAPIRYESFS